MPTVLPSGTVWDFKNNRLLTGHEQLALQGIQLEQPNLTNNQAQDVAGNALPDSLTVGGWWSMWCAVIFLYDLSFTMKAYRGHFFWPSFHSENFVIFIVLTYIHTYHNTYIIHHTYSTLHYLPLQSDIMLEWIWQNQHEPFYAVLENINHQIIKLSVWFLNQYHTTTNQTWAISSLFETKNDKFSLRIMKSDTSEWIVARCLCLQMSIVFFFICGWMTKNNGVYKRCGLMHWEGTLIKAVNVWLYTLYDSLIFSLG